MPSESSNKVYKTYRPSRAVGCTSQLVLKLCQSHWSQDMVGLGKTNGLGFHRNLGQFRKMRGSPCIHDPEGSKRLDKETRKRPNQKQDESDKKRISLTYLFSIVWCILDCYCKGPILIWHNYFGAGARHQMEYFSALFQCWPGCANEASSQSRAVV